MFDECTTDVESKYLFRKLCHLLHPDKGGSGELMILLNKAYENHLISLKAPHASSQKTKPKYDSYKIMAGDDRLGIFDEMFDMVEDNEDLNVEFLINIYNFFGKKGYITVKQYEGLGKWHTIWKHAEKK